MSSVLNICSLSIDSFCVSMLYTSFSSSVNIDPMSKQKKTFVKLDQQFYTLVEWSLLN